MSLYKGNSIISKITCSEDVESVYIGASLIYSARTFPKDTIIANSATDNETGSFTLKNKQNFYVEMYGGGAGGSSSQRDRKWFYGPCGSGAGFVGVVELLQGVYTWKVGAAGYGWNINNQLNMSGSIAGGDSSLLNTSTGETYIY